MADNEYNDEYQFADLDAINPDSPIEDIPPALGDSTGGERRKGKNIKRNALFVIILIVLALLGYKYLGNFFSSQQAEQATSVPSITMPVATQAPEPVQQPVRQEPVVVQTPPAPVSPSIDEEQINQKLSALDLSQQSVRSEVNSVHNALGGVNTNVNDLSEKIANLNHLISELASKVDQQSSQISILTERTKPKPKPIRPIAVKRPSGPRYFIQAVIPGRAWLIAANGSTLTVREGTAITGYGVVKLIDPNQGRVVTSSGRVIKFSPQDS